jgi:hypothetical protein
MKQIVVMTDTVIADGFDRPAGAKVELEQDTASALFARGKCRAPRDDESTLPLTPAPALRPGEAVLITVAPGKKDKEKA